MYPKGHQEWPFQHCPCEAQRCVSGGWDNLLHASIVQLIDVLIACNAIPDSVQYIEKLFITRLPIISLQEGDHPIPITPESKKPSFGKENGPFQMRVTRYADWLQLVGVSCNYDLPPPERQCRRWSGESCLRTWSRASNIWGVSKKASSRSNICITRITSTFSANRIIISRSFSFWKGHDGGDAVKCHSTQLRCNLVSERTCRCYVIAMLSSSFLQILWMRKDFPLPALPIIRYATMTRDWWSSKDAMTVALNQYQISRQVSAAGVWKECDTAVSETNLSRASNLRFNATPYKTNVFSISPAECLK